MAELDTNPPGGTGATPVSPTPVTGTPALGSATPPAAALSLEEAMKRIADLEHKHGNASEELDRHRKKLSTYEKMEKDAEAAKKAAEEAQLSEIGRTKKQHADLQAKYDTDTRHFQERIVRYEVERQAALLGIIDPDAAARLLDWSKLEYENDGTPKNATKLLEALVESKPYLKAPEPTTPAPSVPAQQHAPALPAMNQGRSTIVPPTTLPAGKRPSLAEAYRLAKK